VLGAISGELSRITTELPLECLYQANSNIRPSLIAITFRVAKSYNSSLGIVAAVSVIVT
jgi:hypothetical protein